MGFVLYSFVDDYSTVYREAGRVLPSYRKLGITYNVSRFMQNMYPKHSFQSLAWCTETAEGLQYIRKLGATINDIRVSS